MPHQLVGNDWKCRPSQIKPQKPKTNLTFSKEWKQKRQLIPETKRKINPIHLNKLQELKTRSPTLIQWNCRGIRANYEELQHLLTSNIPKIVCLQETFLKESNTIKFKNYTPYNPFKKDGNRASGGVSILVRNDISQHQIRIDTELQAIDVKATLHKSINIWNICIPPHDPISDTKINKLIEQIPKPHLFLLDLNSHSTVWGYQKKKKEGKDLEKVISTNNFCILNNKSNIYLNPFTGSYLAIDVSLCNHVSYMDYRWKVYNDLCGSDYFPIILENLLLHENRLPH